jgi:hypothetical protein
MADQFLAMDLKNGLKDAEAILRELQWKITSYVDESEVEGFLAACPYYKQLLDTLDSIQASLTVAWTPELEAIRKEEQEEFDRQSDLADAASY